MSEIKNGPCVVCGQPTTHRIGVQKPSGAWSWRAWRCSDLAACATRRKLRKR